MKKSCRAALLRALLQAGLITEGEFDALTE